MRLTRSQNASFTLVAVASVKGLVNLYENKLFVRLMRCNLGSTTTMLDLVSIISLESFVDYYPTRAQTNFESHFPWTQPNPTNNSVDTQLDILNQWQKVILTVWKVHLVGFGLVHRKWL